jgi:DNA-binding MarR family transcriptional regulator
VSRSFAPAAPLDHDYHPGYIDVMDNVVAHNGYWSSASRKAGTLLRGSVRAYARLQHRAVGCCSSTVLQCQVLMELARAEGASAVELARQLGVDKGRVSRTLAVLEAESLGAKRPDDRDGRLASVSLTGAVRERAAGSDRELDEQAKRVLRCVQKDRRRLTVEALRSLAEDGREEAGTDEALLTRWTAVGHGGGEERGWRG